MPRVLSVQLAVVAEVALLAPRNPWFVWSVHRVWVAPVAAVLRLGRPGAVWPAQALATLVLGLGPQAAIPYSDLPAATCVAIALWAGAHGWTGGGRRWWVVAILAPGSGRSRSSHGMPTAMVASPPPPSPSSPS